MITALFWSKFQFKRQWPWFLLSFLLGVMAVLAFLPPALEAQRYVRGEMPELFTVLGFYGDSNLVMLVLSLLFGFILPLLHSVYTVKQASRLISKPLEDGRMSMLLSAPHRKPAIIHTLWLVMLLGSVLLVASSLLGQLAAALVFFPEVKLIDLALLNLGFLPVSLLCMAFALFVAVSSDNARSMKRKTRMVFFVMLALAMASRLSGWTQQLKYLSHWSFFEGSAWALGRATLLPILLALGLTLVFVLLSLAFFSKREL